MNTSKELEIDYFKHNTIYQRHNKINMNYRLTTIRIGGWIVTIL